MKPKQMTPAEKRHLLDTLPAAELDKRWVCQCACGAQMEFATRDLLAETPPRCPVCQP